jgi:glycopeptide antibiotics resistance protein
LNPISTRTWQLAALGYLGVVVYLTLLPFDFSAPISLSEAWERYQNIRFDGSGPRARQQWASNLLMFVPLGFFWAAWWLHRVRNVWLHVLGALPVLVFCLAVTATVEFFQIWIPNRGPSLTDISANATGGVVGVLGWLVSRIPSVRAAGHAILHRQSGLRAWMAVYVAAYVFASLLPLDFILSARELGAKVASTHWGWITAPDGCWWGIRCVAMRALEVLLAVPVGMWVAYRLAGSASRRLMAAVATGLGLGLVVEVGQFLTVSGIAEGASVGTRTLGAALGASVWLLKARIPRRGIHANLRPLLLTALPLYMLVVALLVLTGARGISSWEEVSAQFESMRWLPFYYHYFVAEATAIQSVFMHLAMYAFVGLGVWLWDLRGRGGPRVGRGYQAAAAAALFALVLEALKLSLEGVRPDTSAPILAGLVAGSVYAGLWWWVIPGAQTDPVATPARGDAARPGSWAVEPAGERPPDPDPPPTTGPRWPMLLPVAMVCLYTLSWPVAGVWLGLGLAAYGALLWLWPHAWAVVVPAMLPVLFLAPWSGRFFFDEFDLLLLVTVLVLLAHRPEADHKAALHRGFAFAMGLFALSMGASLIAALWPLPPITPNTFLDYMSPWNGLRVAKGLVWALLLYALVPRSGVPFPVLLERRFVPGMALGLAGLAAILLWERATYPGLFNFQSNYRVTGLFADMHVGGPSIETYLLMALPFVLLWAVGMRRWWIWPVALGLFAAGVYGLFMTYSRAGYLGLGVMGTLLVLGALVQALRTQGGERFAWLLGAALPVVLVAGLWGQVGGGIAEQRLGQVSHDLTVRQELWNRAMDLRDPGVAARLLGQGPGSYPGHYQLRNHEGRLPLNFAFIESPPGEIFLRLGSGDSLYMNQRIGIEQHTDHLLRAHVRGDGRAALGLFVCEKHIKHSFQCRRASLQIPDTDGDWQVMEWRFNSGGLGIGPRFARRGITLALANTRRDTLVDVGQVELLDDRGRDALRNGDFSQGADHWYFTSDSLDAFRVENVWLEILFDQGWPGLIGFVLLTVIAWLHLLRRTLAADPLALGSLASMTGVLTVGVFSGVFWSPRLMMLFFLVLLLFVARPRYSG